MTATSTNNLANFKALTALLEPLVPGLAQGDSLLSLNTAAWQFANRWVTHPVHAGRSLKEIVKSPSPQTSKMAELDIAPADDYKVDSPALFDAELLLHGIGQAYLLFGRKPNHPGTPLGRSQDHAQVIYFNVSDWMDRTVADWEGQIMAEVNGLEKSEPIWRWLRHWVDPRMSLEFQADRLARLSEFLRAGQFCSMYLVLPIGFTVDDVRMFTPTTNWDYTLINTDGQVSEPPALDAARAPVSLCEQWLAAVQQAHIAYYDNMAPAFACADPGPNNPAEVDAQPVADFYVKRRRGYLFMLVHAPRPSAGFEHLRQSGALDGTLSELARGYGLQQNRYHKYDIYYHSIYACDASLGSPIHVRFAALFHDLGKVDTRKVKPSGEATFHNHELISVRHTVRILGRSGFDEEFINHVRFLVRNHMFHYTDEWTDKAVRRFLRKVDNRRLKEMVLLRLADRTGSGKRSNLPKAILHLIEHVDKVEQEARRPTVKDLAIDGHDLKELGFKPGPAFGEALEAALVWMLEDTERNTKEQLREYVTRYFNNKAARTVGESGRLS